MTNLKLRPVLKETVFKNKTEGIILTANHATTSLVWDIMSTVDNIGVFDRQRQNDTQIAFWFNPGYDMEALRSFLVPATYIAVTYKDVGSFWELGLGKHMIAYHDHLDFSGLLEPELGQTIISAWILSKAKIVLDNTHRDATMGKSFNRDVTKARVTHAKAALVRLELLDPSKVTLTRKEILGRITEVKALIKLLENDHLILCQWADMADAVREAATQSRQIFSNLISKGPIASEELYQVWKSALKRVGQYSDELDEIVNKYSDDDGIAYLERITEITPAAPVK